MKYGGFKVNYTDDLKRYLTKDISNCYTICNEDIKINRERLVERLIFIDGQSARNQSIWLSMKN